MTSLPIPLNTIALDGRPSLREEDSLAQAFTSFIRTAQSLENSYQQLQSEVMRLRNQLEERNRELLASLEENRHTRQFLHEILEMLPCGVLVVRRDGEVSVANPEARRLLGVAASPDRFEPSQLPAWLPLAADTATAKSSHEQECCAAEGKCVAVRRVKVETAEGICSLLMLRDISEVKQLEALQSALRRREALAEMAAVLAHEIRNPLGSLELFAGLLAGALQLQPEYRNWARQVQAGLRTLSATVNNVLEFHSMGVPQLVPVELEPLLQSFESLLGPLAEQSGVELKREGEPGGVWVLADRSQLQQVLFNLALNAIRFMPQGGSLEIRSRVEKSRGSLWTVIEVEDTGPGIPAENRGRIFEAGFTTRTGSAGLGLAVCKTIVEKHCGRISVGDGQAGGASFRLEFPMAAEQGRK